MYRHCLHQELLVTMADSCKNLQLYKLTIFIYTHIPLQTQGEEFSEEKFLTLNLLLGKVIRAQDRGLVITSAH